MREANSYVGERLEDLTLSKRKFDLFQRRYTKAINLINQETEKYGQLTLFDVFFGEGHQLQLYQKNLRKDIDARIVGVDARPTIRNLQIRNNLEVVVYGGDFFSEDIISRLDEESKRSKNRIVLSMESIEHIDGKKQKDYLTSLYGLLRKGEPLILSTPNGKNTSRNNGIERLSPNPFHLKELNFEELKGLIQSSSGQLESAYCMGAGLGLLSRFWLNNISKEKNSIEDLQKAHYGTRMKQHLISIADKQPFRHILTRTYNGIFMDSAISMYVITRKI